VAGATETPLAGVLLAGVLLAGVLLAGVLLAGVLLAGVLLAGVLLAGVLLAATAGFAAPVDPAGAVPHPARAASPAATTSTAPRMSLDITLTSSRSQRPLASFLRASGRHLRTRRPM
jgi:hypothetical protein